MSSSQAWSSHDGHMSLHGLMGLCDVERDVQLFRRERQGPSRVQQSQLYERASPPFCESFLAYLYV